MANQLAKNLMLYMETNNVSQRDLAKLIQLSQPSLSRILSNKSQAVQPTTKRKISNFFGFKFEDIISKELSVLQTEKSSYNVRFIDLYGEATNDKIETNEEYAFALNIKNDNFHPLFPKSSILFFSKEPAFQNDICITKQNNKLNLCSVINSYRLELDVVNLESNDKFSVLRNNIVAVLMKSLNPN